MSYYTKMAKMFDVFRVALTSLNLLCYQTEHTLNSNLNFNPGLTLIAIWTTGCSTFATFNQGSRRSIKDQDVQSRIKMFNQESRRSIKNQDVQSRIKTFNQESRRSIKNQDVQSRIKTFNQESRCSIKNQDVQSRIKTFNQESRRSIKVFATFYKPYVVLLLSWSNAKYIWAFQSFSDSLYIRLEKI